MRENYNLQLVGQTVILVPYRKKYVERYALWMKDEWLREMTASDECSLSEEMEAQKHWVDDPKKLTFIVLDAAHPGATTGCIDAMAGDVNLIVDPHDSSVAEVLVMIAEPSCRRRGFAAAAVSLLMFFARSKLGIKRFFCKINETNEASINLFENKLNFTRCGYVAVFKEIELELTVVTSNSKARPAELVNARPYQDNTSEPQACAAEVVLGAATEAATEAAESAVGSNRLKSTECPPPPPTAQRRLGVELRASAPRVKLQTFGACVGDGIADVTFCGQVMLMDGCCFINLVESGTSAPAMGETSVAMETRFETMPLVTTLLGDADELPRVLTQHLAKRTSLQCFVSSSLPESAAMFSPQITAHIQKAICSLQG